MFTLRVNEILAEKDKSIYWLAKQTGISANNMGNICNGKTSIIRFDTLERICKVLECTPNDVFVSDDPTIKHLMDK